MDKNNAPLISIENLHIHMDERMNSTNFYHPERSDCCDCPALDCCDTDCDDCICRDCPGCDCDDEVEISMAELVSEIKKETGLPDDVIKRVLAAESAVLSSVDIVPDIRVAESDDHIEDGDHIEADNHTEEEVPTERVKKNAAPHMATIPDELKEKLAPIMAGIALIGFLKELCGVNESAEADQTEADDRTKG